METSPPAVPEPAGRGPRALALLCAVLALDAIYAAALAPPAQWGWHFRSYLSPGARLACLGVAALVPLGVAALARARLRATVPRRLVLLGVLAVLAALFFMFREAAPLYGDGVALLSDLATRAPLPAHEPLAQLAHALAFRLAGEIAGSGAPPPVQVAFASATLVSIACGLGSAICVWRLVAGSGAAEDERPFGALGLCALVLAQGHVAIFFGHAENYAPFALAALAYAAVGLCALRRPRLLLPAGALLALAISSHLLGLLLVPSWIGLALLRQGPPPRTAHGVARAAFLAVAPLLASALCFLALTPWLQPDGGRLASLVSSLADLVRARRDLAQTANGVHLMGPAGLALFSLSLARSRAPGLEPDAARTFLGLLGGPSLAAVLLLGDSNLGFIRNWDLLAAPSLIATCAGAGLLVRTLDGRERDRWVPVLLSLSLLHTTSWVGVCSRTDRSFHRLVGASPADGSAEATLGLWRAMNGMSREARAIWEAGLAKAPGHVRILLYLGHLSLDEGRPDDAVGFYERAREAAPYRVAPLAGQILALHSSGRLDQARRLAREQRLLLARTVDGALLSRLIDPGDRADAVTYGPVLAALRSASLGRD